MARLLRAGESRWTLSARYAVVYDNLDTGTNKITDRGRDGLMFNAGRQTVWLLPLPLPRGALGLEFELGLNYAARRIPSNGTRMSFSVITGFEWSHAPGDRHEWVTGVRWLHLSHGGLFGPNGGYDGLIFRLGRRWSRYRGGWTVLSAHRLAASAGETRPEIAFPPRATEPKFRSNHSLALVATSASEWVIRRNCGI
ncbi:MAG: acyloxyacyl hydrolase [Verrucomicrobia bacterium]|nr:acyloxyacyl hydrolase [Verrucomicrobiota bacterium]